MQSAPLPHPVQPHAALPPTLSAVPFPFPRCQVEEEFSGRWEAGAVDGWEDKGVSSAGSGSAPSIDLEAFSSAEELEILGACCGCRMCVQ